MAKKVNNQKPEHNEAVGTAISKTEDFLHKNKKTIIYSLSGLAVVALLIVGYIYLLHKPRQKEAIDQTFVAEQYFRADNFEAALNGDGNALGFSQLINEYGKKCGEAVYFYAGICEYKLGNYQSSVDYLKKYNGKDPILKARALCCTGDAYVGLENYGKALNLYLEAAAFADNTLAASYLLKAGIIAEEMGNNAKALECYKSIKEKYPQTFEGYEIDKYISRLTVKE